MKLPRWIQSSISWLHEKAAEKPVVGREVFFRKDDGTVARGLVTQKYYGDFGESIVQIEYFRWHLGYPVIERQSEYLSNVRFVGD